MAHDPVRHALFFEPDGAVRSAVAAWKVRVAERWPRAKYLAHPAHGTLWVGDAPDSRLLRGLLGSVAASIDAFAISIRGAHVFYDDALAGGGQTCVFAVDLTEPLVDLQQRLCECLAAHRQPVGDEDLPLVLRRPPYFQSWRRYGFPFVGAHWIPHLSIAAVPVGRDDPFVNEFRREASAGEMRLSGVSWWRVAGDHHERLAWFPLAD